MTFECRNHTIVVGSYSVYVYDTNGLCFVCESIGEAEAYIYEKEELPQ